MSAFVVSVAALLFGSVTSRRISRPIVMGWIVLSIIFFAPAVIATNPSIALAFFAHPLQYIVMMVFMAGFGSSANRAAPMVRVGALLTCGLTLWAVIWLLNNPISQFSLGAKLALAFTYGVTQWHFLADAGLWKLRDPAVRKNFMDSFGFMFRAR